MIAIILYGSFELAPYARLYMQMLDEMGKEYHLIGRKQEAEITYSGDNVFVYEGDVPKRFSSLVGKIRPSVDYRRFVKKLIKKYKYDRLVILTTQTAVILADVLFGKYRHRYIFDYRDRSYEYIAPYRALVNGFIKNSVCTAVSSPWFVEGLVKNDYLLVHNFRSECLERAKHECIKRKDGEKIVIGYVGALRSFDYHTTLIDIFANDDRYEFYTYGCGDDTETLAEYASEFSNIHICGAYNENEKYDIIEKFDMMIYNYPYNYVNDRAVANKYYDSLIMKKPMIVNPKTVLGKYIVKNGLGVGIDTADAHCADSICKWYRSFDADVFVRRCDEHMAQYAADNRWFEQSMKRALDF